MTDRFQRLKEHTSRPIPPSTIPDGPPTDYFAFMQSSPAGSVRKIPIDRIDPWKDDLHECQPFHPYNGTKLQELSKNIRLNGVISPVRLRPSPYDRSRYQTLAGHNRIAAARLAGLREVPAMIEDVDDDQARLILVDSNLYQREKLLPSERAFAYKLKLESLKHQGSRTDLTSTHSVSKLQPEESAPSTSTHRVSKLCSLEQVGDENKESRETVRRYIRLTYLIPEFLDMVDAETLPFLSGVALSFLTPEQQHLVLSVMQREQIQTIRKNQAEDLKALREELSEETILRIFGRCVATESQHPLRFSVILPPAVSAKYAHDTALQALVADTVQRYITEKETSHKTET